MAIPKEMFPVGRYPAIEWVIAEAVASGCTDIAVVISPGKQVIREYLSGCRMNFSGQCKLTFVTQSEPLGLGHALLITREFIAGQAFAVFLPDSLTAGPDLPLLQLKNAFAVWGGAVFALVSASSGTRPRWPGQWDLTEVAARIYRVYPSRGDAPPAGDVRQFEGVGRYLLSAEFLDYAACLFNRQGQGVIDDGMIFEFMCTLGRPVSGVVIENRHFDISTADGYVAAWQVLGRSEPEDRYPSVSWGR